MSEPMLVVEDLDVSYGASQALFGVSLEVEAGSTRGRAGSQWRRQEHTGPNRVRDWCLRPRDGSDFNGIDITKRAAHKLSADGLTHIPEGRGIFPGLTVLENLRMAVRQLTRGERSTRPSTGRSISSRCSANAVDRGPGPSRVASSRCWRWPEPWR